MRRYVLATVITLALVSTLAAQTKVDSKPAPAAKASAIPRTPDGHPDLSGVYSNATTVPVARPANLGAKEFYTDEADRTASAAAGRGAGRGGAAGAAAGGRGGRGGGAAAAADPEGGPALQVHYSTDQFGLSGASVVRAPSLRTSIITGPEGKVPELTAEAKKRAADKAAFNREHQWDGPETRPLAERCITWGHVGPPMMPAGYNSDLQIVQGQGTVAVVQEMIHDFRVIPTDGSRPHLPAGIGEWMGDARGHWDGDTLVVETTNFNGKTQVQGAWITDQLKVTERFTRTDAETVLYQFTVDDPGTWVKPWSGELTLTKIDAPLFEYACTEGNYGMANNLSGARATEKK
jgi:hypothetical protein